VIEEGLKLGSKSLDDLVDARKAEMAGDTATAVTRLEAIAAREEFDPLRPPALNRLGLLLFEQGHYEASLAMLRRFLDDYPDHDQAPVVRRTVGRVYEVGLGRYDEALKEYEQVLMSYPQYALLDDVRRDVTRVRAAAQGATYAP
jgi:tetratricopeptide (TPR) repeat protein